MDYDKNFLFFVDLDVAGKNVVVRKGLQFVFPFH